MSFAIRAARPDDSAILAGIHGRCFDEAWDEQSFDHLLRQQGVVALLGRKPDAHAWQAFILLQVTAGDAEILSLGTSPGARRAGLASALLKAAADAAARHDVTHMFLEVAKDNEPALELYARHGFVRVGRRPGYYVRAGGVAVDALILRAPLPLQDNGNEPRSRLD